MYTVVISKLCPAGLATSQHQYWQHRIDRLSSLDYEALSESEQSKGKIKWVSSRTMATWQESEVPGPVQVSRAVREVWK